MSARPAAPRDTAPAAAQAALSPLWTRDDRSAAVLTAMAWVLIVLMIVPDGFDYANLTTLGAPTSGSPLTRLLWLALLGGGIAIVASRATLAWLLFRHLNPFLPLFMALAFVSVAWSIEPALTLRRCIRMATFLLVALSLALTGWHRRRFQEVVRPILTLMLAGSVAFCLVFPQYGVHQESSAELVGAWRGLTNHKNTLGALSCIGLILWVHAWLTGEAGRFVALCGSALAGMCLLLSRSSTSLMAAAFATLLMLFFLRTPPQLRRHMPFIVGLFVALLLTYSMAILKLVPGLDVLLQPIVAFTGKDLSFTGRSEIWAIISEHIQDHPLFGTGYGAYWSLTPGSPSMEFLTRMYFYPESAHNGYLEITNDLGAAGLVCLIGYLIAYVRQSLRLLERSREQCALYFALFLQQALTNLSETHWLSPMSANCVIMIIATVSIGRCLLDEGLRGYFGEPFAATPAAVDGRGLA